MNKPQIWCTVSLVLFTSYEIPPWTCHQRRRCWPIDCHSRPQRCHRSCPQWRQSVSAAGPETDLWPQSASWTGHHWRIPEISSIKEPLSSEVCQELPQYFSIPREHTWLHFLTCMHWLLLSATTTLPLLEAEIPCRFVNSPFSLPREPYK